LHIHISNLNRKTTATDVSRLFSGFGTIAVGRMTYVLDVRTRLAVGHVFVDVENAVNGEEAIKKLNGSVVTGNVISVKQSG
jgi:RNA recognition motif-containing protein